MQVLKILSNFTVEEIKFLISYFDELGAIDNKEQIRKIIDSEQRIQGITYGHFHATLESCHDPKGRTKEDKIAKKLKNKYIREKDFFELVVAICEKNLEIEAYIKTPFGC